MRGRRQQAVQVCQAGRRRSMERPASVDRNRESVNAPCTDSHPVTRRALGPIALGCVSSLLIDGLAGARAQPAVPKAEPEGPDHLARRRVQVLDTEISYIDTGTGDP